MFCKHRWQKMDELSVPSKAEVLTSLVKRGTVEGSESLLYREKVGVYCCLDCGKFKTVRVSNVQS